MTTFVIAAEFSVFCVCVASSCVWSPSFFFADSEGGKLFIESQTKRVTAPFFFFVFFKMSQLIKNVIIIKKRAEILFL